MTTASDDRTRTLQEWRAIKGFSKSTVARHLGVHPSTYARIEDHPEKMEVETAVKLGALFECQIKQIIFFKQKPNLNLEFPQSS